MVAISAAIDIICKVAILVFVVRILNATTLRNKSSRAIFGSEMSRNVAERFTTSSPVTYIVESSAILYIGGQFIALIVNS